MRYISTKCETYGLDHFLVTINLITLGLWEYCQIKNIFYYISVMGILAKNMY